MYICAILHLLAISPHIDYLQIEKSTNNLYRLKLFTLMHIMECM